MRDNPLGAYISVRISGRIGYNETARAIDRSVLPGSDGCRRRAASGTCGKTTGRIRELGPQILFLNSSHHILQRYWTNYVL